MTLTYRSTVGRRLTVTEGDGNISHLANREIWAAEHGHSSSASAAVNDTALVAAIQKAYDAGGGTVRMGEGSFNHVTTPFNWLATRTIILKGAGKKATYLVKNGATTSAVLYLSADTGVLDTQISLEDFSITGNAKGHHGVTVSTLARYTTKNFGATACDIGWNSVGCLIGKHDNILLNSNNIGYKSRKSGSVYCNLVIFDAGEVRANSSFGYDIGDAYSFTVRGTDIEANGTTSNTATGQVIIRDTVDDETGYSNIVFDGAWFEGGLGENFKVEAAGGLMLTLRDCPMIASEAGKVMNVGAIDTIILQNITAGSSGDTATIAAANCIIDGGVIDTITDSSTNKNYRDVTTSSGVTQLQVTGGGYDFRVNNGNVRTGGGTVATTSGAAATVITAPSIGAMYQVYSYVSGSGADYMSHAIIGTDGTSTVRISGTDAANISTTVSGANIQVTQTSGTGQVVSYEYLRIA
jgi:hypothetical protein